MSKDKSRQIVWHNGDKVVIGKNESYRERFVGKQGVIEKCHGKEMVDNMYDVRLDNGFVFCLNGNNLYTVKKKH